MQGCEHSPTLFTRLTIKEPVDGLEGKIAYEPYFAANRFDGCLIAGRRVCAGHGLVSRRLPRRQAARGVEHALHQAAHASAHHPPAAPGAGRGSQADLHHAAPGRPTGLALHSRVVAGGSLGTDRGGHRQPRAAGRLRQLRDAAAALARDLRARPYPADLLRPDRQAPAGRAGAGLPLPRLRGPAAVDR